MFVSYLLGAIIVGAGLFLLIRSVKREATDGCYACPSRNSCSKASCKTLVDIKTQNPKGNNIENLKENNIENP